MSKRLVQDRSDTSSGGRRPNDAIVVELPPLLAAPTLEVGERWAIRVLSCLRRDSRRICGGWPGTITEARALLADDLLPNLKGESLEAFESVGHLRVARFLYQSARRYWVRKGSRNVETSD